MINDLPDDLLVKILKQVTTKDAVATMFLSKQWLSIWTMIPTLKYEDIEGEDKSVWKFLDRSLKLHKAPILKIIDVTLGPQCPIDVDVINWITNAVDRRVCNLQFTLNWSAQHINLPTKLYNLDTLVLLNLCHKIIVDIVSPANLPSLKYLFLKYVVYKDEDSVVNLVSNCPILKFLCIAREHKEDNLKNIRLKISSLQSLHYSNIRVDNVTGIIRSLVIDSPNLKTMYIRDFSRDSYSIKTTTLLNKAFIYVNYCSTETFNTNCFSLTYLSINLNIAVVCKRS